MPIKIPAKDPQFKRILTFSVLHIAAVIVSLSCVIAYMASNDLSKGRWAFFIFVCFLALLFAVLTPSLYAANIPRSYSNLNWPVILSIPAIILAILLFIGSVVISVHIHRSCMKYCVLVTVAAVAAFLMTILFLLEAFQLFTKPFASREEKCSSKVGIVNRMESSQL